MFLFSVSPFEYSDLLSLISILITTSPSFVSFKIFTYIIIFFLSIQTFYVNEPQSNLLKKKKTNEYDTFLFLFL